MTRPLYELVQDSKRIEDLLIESGGEITPEVEALVQVTERGLEQKVDSYAYVLKKLEHEQEFWDKEAKRLTNMANSFKTARTRLKENLKACLMTMPDQAIKGELSAFKLSRTKPALKVHNIDQVPADYIVVCQTLETDNDKIREDLEKGIEIPGVELIESYSLRSMVKRD